MKRIIQSMATLALPVVLATGTRAAAPDVKVEFTGQGELSLTLDGQTISQPTKYPNPSVRFRDPAATVPLWGGNDTLWPVVGADCQPTTNLFDAVRRQLTQKFAWGEVVRTYRVVRGGVDIEMAVHNKSAKTLCEFQQRLFTLKLPYETGPALTTEAMYFGAATPAQSGDTLSGPVALPLVGGAGYGDNRGKDSRAIVATTPEIKHLALRWETDTWIPPWDPRKVASYAANDPVAMDLAAKQGAPQTFAMGENWCLMLQVGGDRLLYHDRYTSRPIPPGARDTYVVWLRFGDAADPLAPAREALQGYGKAHPMKFHWADRRPIVGSMIGDSFPYHEPQGPTLQRPKGVVASPEFRKNLLASADEQIAKMKKINAQGIIVWNIEGNGPSYLKYVGDPHMIEYMCPEANAVADEFFKKFRDAGFQVGVCLRPSVIDICESAKNPDVKTHFPNAKSPYAYFHNYPHKTRSPADILSEKVAYAKKRWGCTLFYVDTNHAAGWWPETDAEKAAWPKHADGSLQWYHALLNEDVWAEVLRRHPDVLFTIEHTPLIQYTVDAPYDGLDTPMDGTPAVVRATWPEAFKCLVIYEGKYFWRAVDAAWRGDVLFGQGEFVEMAQAAAECLKAGPPATLAKLDAAGLLSIATDPKADQLARFFATKRLYAGGLEAKAVDALLKSPDKIVALMAVEALATADQIKTHISDLVRLEGGHAQYGVYAGAIREAIGRGGRDALAALADYARKMPADALRALNMISITPGPGSTEQLAAVVSDASLPDGTRLAAAGNLGWRKDATVAQKDAALDYLLPLLRNAELRLTVVTILHARYVWQHGLWNNDPRVLAAATAALAAERAEAQPDQRVVALLEKILNRQQ